MKRTSHGLPWERKALRRKRHQHPELPSGLFPPSSIGCPAARGRVTIHKDAVQANRSRSYQGQRHFLPMTGQAVLKGKPTAKSEGNSQQRKHETLPALKWWWASALSMPLPLHVQNSVSPLDNLGWAPNASPPIQLPHGNTNFSVTQIWAFPCLV